MKKAWMALGIVLSMIIAMVAALLFSLQTQYRVDVANFILKQAFDQPIIVEDIRYHAPYQITLSGIQLPQDKPLYIEQISLWLSSDSFTQRQWVFDSVLIDGINVQQSSSSPFNVMAFLTHNKIKLHQLAINNLDFSIESASPNKTFNARNLNIQVVNPQWLDGQQQLPYGKLQLTAEQIYWQDEAINNVLVDADYKPSDSTVYGGSFLWREASVSGQAEQFGKKWSLINVTIDGLRLNKNQTKSILSKNWQLDNTAINHLNSLDILRSDIQWQQGHLAGFDVSVENIKIPFNHWQQDQGSISIQADSVDLGVEMWVEPSVKLTLQPNKIIINDFFTNWMQGYVQLNGIATPVSLNLNQLSIQGVKWFEEESRHNKPLPFDYSDWLNTLQSLKVQNLNIERSQFIQLAKKPYWQLSGLSVEGKQLSIIDNHKLGLWQGQLQASANNASYRDIFSSHPLIEMNSQQGVWQLTRFFAPLENGYIDAHSTLDFSQPSQPWSVNITADGLPISPFIEQLNWPFKMTGISEFELQASGLGGDALMFNHTLNGQIIGNIRHGELTFKPSSPKPSKERFTLSDVNLEVDRGRVNLRPALLTSKSWAGSVKGKFDLLNPQTNSLFLSLSKGCDRYSGLLTNIQYSQDLACKQKTPLKSSSVHTVVE